MHFLGLTCLPEDELLQLIQPVVSQCISNGVEEAEVVLKIMHHEQDASQQLIGHQEVMDIGSTMVLTAVTGASMYQRTKIIPVPFFLQKYLE